VTSADERRRQIVVCPPVYAAGLAISPCVAAADEPHAFWKKEIDDVPNRIVSDFELVESKDTESSESRETITVL
jgi:hypothetical protein